MAEFMEKNTDAEEQNTGENRQHGSR
jgi:hypothetical protein